jgi:hypothetical protein
MNGTIDDILIIDAWNEYNIDDRFCIKKAWNMIGFFGDAKKVNFRPV